MKKTFIKLLQELRTYILIWLVVFLFVVCGSFVLKQYIYNIITLPLYNNKGILLTTENTNIFIYTSIFESFIADLMLSVYSALFLSLPIVYILIYRFISKSLYKKEKRVVLPLFIISFLLAIIAIIINYNILFPRIINFFLQITTIAKPMLKISDYVITFFSLTTILCLILQFPIILIILKKFGFINNNILVKKRKISIVIMFIISAIITPPDILSQIIVACLLMLIYEITNLILKKL